MRTGARSRDSEQARAVIGQRCRPAFGGLDRVGRAIDMQARHGAQRLEMLDRLVGRPILAKADRVGS